MSELHDAIALAAPYLNRYGYGAVFGALLLESFGLPLPGEAMLIAGGALAAEGELHLAPLLACAWLAAVVGDNIGFAIGRFGGRRLIVRYGGRIGITESRLTKVEVFFRRYGGQVVLVARFFALLRQLNGIVAGSVGMGWWRFLDLQRGGRGALGKRLGHLARIPSANGSVAHRPLVHRLGYLAIGLTALACSPPSSCCTAGGAAGARSTRTEIAASLQPPFSAETGNADSAAAAAGLIVAARDGQTAGGTAVRTARPRPPRSPA